ncbi:hypothetical protein EJ110_NYTH21651 [Nymphaea thermarum]|nr:hypothetical protein EJ110_NYTH21651 [Nymphaea thermarum]
MAKECFTINDLTFSNRLGYAAARYLADDGYGSGCSVWRSLARDEKDSGGGDALKPAARFTSGILCTSEINAQVGEEAYRLRLANEQQPVKVDVRKLLKELTFNVVARTVAVKDYAVAEAKMTRKHVHLAVAAGRQ